MPGPAAPRRGPEPPAAGPPGLTEAILAEVPVLEPAQTWWVRGALVCVAVAQVELAAAVVKALPGDLAVGFTPPPRLVVPELGKLDRTTCAIV